MIALSAPAFVLLHMMRGGADPANRPNGQGLRGTVRRYNGFT
jgi:hypothetical protein